MSLNTCWNIFSLLAGEKQLTSWILHGFNFCLGSYCIWNCECFSKYQTWEILETANVYVFPFEDQCAKFMFSSLKKLFKISRAWYSCSEDSQRREPSFKVFTSSGPTFLENFYFHSFSDHNLLWMTCQYFQQEQD